MRNAGTRIAELYKTQIGQDVLETLLGAGVSATGQLVATDMTPEQIAMSTVLGIGAATVGRPIVGRAGQMIGNRIKNPAIHEIAADMVNPNQIPPGMLRDMYEAKLAPFKDLSAPAQVGQLFGRGYGDNIAQLAVALAAPQFVDSLRPEDVEQ